MILLMLVVLFCCSTLGQTPSQTESTLPMSVSNLKWSKSRRAVEPTNTPAPGPAAAMIPQNKIFARNARMNEPPGSRDPNQDTIDGRSAALEKSVQESRTTEPKFQNGFLYKVKVLNQTKKEVEALFWEYQFTDPSDPNLTSRHQFLCGVTIRSEKSANLEGFGLSGPVDVVSVDTLAHKSDKVFHEKVVINRIEYTDGTLWQRKGWSFGEVKHNYERVLHEPWAPGMCKAL
jgi:hypothetical protein